MLIWKTLVLSVARHSAQRAASGLLEEPMILKAVLKSATMELGAQCVTISGQTWMLWLLALNLDFQQQVRTEIVFLEILKQKCTFIACVLPSNTLVKSAK